MSSSPTDPGGGSRRVYIEDFDGDQLSAAALAACGVRISIGTTPRPRARLLKQVGQALVHEIPDPAPRAALMPLASAIFLPENAILNQLRPGGADLTHSVLLPASAKASAPADAGSNALTSVVPIAFERKVPDEIVIRYDSPVPAYVRVIETFDAGWSATIDGASVAIIPANQAMMAIATPSGEHELRLRFVTPGRTIGATVSLLSATALLLIAMKPTRRAKMRSVNIR